ncbi:MAG: peptidase M20 [Rhodospirillaceae bacterium]|nr:peptidase M20 [Rhodospirillaceae bacterium]
MPVINRIAEFANEMTEWRHRIHANPETAFEEYNTADFVSEKLKSFGITVNRGLARTGVVGTLIGNQGKGPGIGLRADMDALNIEERSSHEYASKVSGKMHACGHDGHTSMLLGAAKYLSETRNFSGRVQFIFQPAEEFAGGGREMVQDGLFDKFPVDTVWGMHNFPGQKLGTFAVCQGPAMAAADTFDISLRGSGTHAGFPNTGTDVVVAAAHVISMLQTIVSRRVDPVESVVCSVTQVNAGDTYNVIPDNVSLRGTVRTLKSGLQDDVEKAIKQIILGTKTSFHLDEVKLKYTRGYPPTVNDVTESVFAAEVAADVVGRNNVDITQSPKMAAEDFSFMLNERPGCYIWLGNGTGENIAHLHNPYYDFNDEALAIGASYWARLVEMRLSK